LYLFLILVKIIVASYHTNKEYSGSINMCNVMFACCNDWRCFFWFSSFSNLLVKVLPYTSRHTLTPMLFNNNFTTFVSICRSISYPWLLMNKEWIIVPLCGCLHFCLQIGVSNLRHWCLQLNVLSSMP
jgi:hypothetical protein